MICNYERFKNDNPDKMAKGDHCSVYGCDNDRRYPERYRRQFLWSFLFFYIPVHREPFTVRQERINNLVVLYFRCVTKPHVFKLQWHSKDPKYFKLWERLIGRKNFKVTKNTKVCSNHFVFGKPLGEHLHPELWLRG